MIVTIAQLATSGDFEALAPVWQDKHGVQYRVTSALVDELPEGAWTPEIDAPAPAAPAMIAGVDGLTALALMELTLPDQPQG